ncbi:MAG: NAD-dependent epimerase/dehydratase family protein [Phycisphaerae bacterium]
MEDESRDIALVTGGTGLLGSHIVEQLCKRGRRVRALVRLESDTTWLRTQDVELVVGDVTDPDSLKRACAGVKIVYHAAARVGDWGKWDDFVRVSIDGTGNLLEAAIDAGVGRFLHISSISAYGHVDGEGLVIDESAPLGRQLARWSYYSRAKVDAEKLVWAAHRDGRLDVTVIRPSWLYGPRDRVTLGRIIKAIRRRKTKLIGDGTNRLSVVHAANVAQAAILAAEFDAARGEAYNCSNDGEITQAEYFNAIAAAIGEPPVTRKVPYGVAKSAAFLFEVVGHLFRMKKPPLVTRYSVWLIGRRSFFETQKARRQLGWQPTISYETGIPAAVRWYLHEHEGTSTPAGIATAQAQLS